MTATVKSRVLVREEKGMGGVSMKRLVFCGMGAGMLYMLVNLSPLSHLSIPVLFIAFALGVYLTGQTYGIARYRWWLLNGRGRLLLHLYRHPTGLLAQILDGFDVGQALIHGADLFRAAQTADDLFGGVQILDSDAEGGFEILADDRNVA